MSNNVIKVDKLNYVLVEGIDDVHVFNHLLRYYGLDSQVTIQQKEGIDNLLETLEVELKRPAETRLGIVVDADTDIASRWQSLRHKIIAADYSSVPLHPASGGTILKQEGRPMVGLWLMPDNTLPGMPTNCATRCDR